jgi:hypothetical protein
MSGSFYESTYSSLLSWGGVRESLKDAATEPARPNSIVLGLI